MELTEYERSVLEGDAERIVCLSSSYIAMLDALGEVDRVAGVSGMDFITNPYIQANRDRITDVGYDGNTDYEMLLASAPDIVLLYGITGASGMEGKLKELGIPFMYIGEYMSATSNPQSCSYIRSLVESMAFTVSPAALKFSP